MRTFSYSICIQSIFDTVKYLMSFKITCIKPKKFKTNIITIKAGLYASLLRLGRSR